MLLSLPHYWITGLYVLDTLRFSQQIILQVFQDCCPHDLIIQESLAPSNSVWEPLARLLHHSPIATYFGHTLQIYRYSPSEVYLEYLSAVPQLQPWWLAGMYLLPFLVIKSRHTLKWLSVASSLAQNYTYLNSGQPTWTVYPFICIFLKCLPHVLLCCIGLPKHLAILSL